MALWDRLSRVLASFRQERLGERELVGIQGEEYATDVIARLNPQCHIPNAVVPSANGRYCETDHVVLVGGTVFIVEVKNFKGRLVWEDASERGLMHWKAGNYGETILPKPAKNPLAQARSYIRPAKAYLSTRCDRRFANVYMEPVGVFTRTADITAIHSLEKGLIYLEELPAFFASRRNDRFAEHPSAWLLGGLRALPRLDVIRSKDGQLFRGFLEGSYLEYRGPDRRNYQWPWHDLEWIYLESGFFSSTDRVTVQLRSGQKLESAAVQGLVKIVSLDGQRSEHRLSNLAVIAPSPIRSTANAVGFAARV